MICLAIDIVGYWASVEAESSSWQPLQGQWDIVSVSRDGELDPTHLGATLVFAGDSVKFEPRHSGWNDLFLQDQPLSSITSTYWESLNQGRPATIPDGSS